MALSLFDLNNSQPANINQFLGNNIVPEPSFLITIEPILTNGNTTEVGKILSINLDGVETLVDFIQIQINGTQQLISLFYQNISIFTLSNIYVLGFDCSNFLFAGNAGCSLQLTATNITSNSDGYDLSSPLIDLFREGDIVRISMGLPNVQEVDLFIGSINNIGINYSSNNLSINLRVENLLNILARSSAVQTSDNQQLNQEFLNPITSQIYNFNNLLMGLLDETIIPQAITSAGASPSILYYRGITDGVPEIEAVGDQGSAISVNSNIYAYTAPTESKLNVILQTLYAYQRIFYIDNSGNFIITPLQNYFNEANNWKLGMQGSNDLIPLTEITIEKNTSNIQNRVFISILNILNQFNKSNVTGSNNKSNAYSVATTNSVYFPRLTEYVDSGLYLQTLFSTQEINENILQNSGLLNIAQNFKNVQGLSSIINVDGNQTFITSNSELDKLKYYTSLYAAKNLAEQLFNDTRITVTIPTNQTFNVATNRFRSIPLNELVYVPPVNNNVFDGLQQYFCYGYSLSYDRNDGAMTTLHLTKPFTYTALWADRIEQLS